MLSRAHSGHVTGIDALAIDVEVDITQSTLPHFKIIGLPDTSIRESRARIRSAIKNSGFKFPNDRITVNLAPACIKKIGSGFDLPIAVAILASSGYLEPQLLKNIVLLGELSLDGKLIPIRGVLPMIASLKNKYGAAIVPCHNKYEAAAIHGIDVFGANNLKDVISHISGIKKIRKTSMDENIICSDSCKNTKNMNDVKGQYFAKRAMQIAAAGRHNMLMIGPPGSGKSMLAERFSGILTKLSHEESVEITKVYSIAGKSNEKGLIKHRPFRAPHHTISYAAMVGGGTNPSPGEITLAHNGVLFLDELPEFRRDVIESLRQPMESGIITVSRAGGTVRYPSRFVLIAAMNGCPCGNYTDPKKECRCTHYQIQKYLSKISGPILDRIDIHIEVPRLNYKEITNDTPETSSQDILKKVSRAQDIQHNRFKHKDKAYSYNAYIQPGELKNICRTSPETEKLFKKVLTEFDLSMRAYNKILKIARTIADLDEKEIISPIHAAEAISYRCLDKKIWG